MLSPLTRTLLVVLLAVFAVLGVLFRRRQNRQGTRGGRISPPKVAWLFFALYFWFVVCPAVALDPAVSSAAGWVLGLFGASMWLRGAAEMYLLYVTRSWRPPYGIGHDVLCIALVLGGLAWHHEHWTGALSSSEVWALALMGLVLASLVIEIAYAALFHHAVEGATTGEDGVWFADEEQARFRRINRLTFAFNVPMYGTLAALLAWGFGLASP
ncbi:hypothetical protein [Hyalangium minutum]|uniref:Integral membrane protein n=1 Tax=Hyalangium minutum TaxID=394096 RepID=A0A085WEJ7_9BACT|nr:hypothetical protein [Hyalangium minutum]KFE66110.1 hypothetical protein DB31_1175 [Hyalangium minutum]